MISPPTSSLLILPLLLSFGGGGKASSSVVVQSFQIITPLPPPSRIHAAITARRIDRDGTAINARRTPSPASAGYSITPSLLSSHPIKSKSIAPSSLFATADSEPSTTTTTTEEEEFSEIKEMRGQVDEINSSLKEAKKRQGEVDENVGKLREEKMRMESETEGLIDTLRNGLVDEMTNLSDKIEGAQDSLRSTLSKTKVEISSLRNEFNEREEDLKSEISQLENRLATLRQEADVASKERDALNKSFEKDARKVRAESTKEMNTVKKGAYARKKEITHDNYDLENRIQQAKMEYIPTSELEEEKRTSLPKIAALKNALSEMKRKMSPKVEDMKEKRAASEMFFDTNWKELKQDKKMEIDVAKSVYEKEMVDEDEKLEKAALYYEKELETRGEELKRTLDSLNEPVESNADVLSAIEKATKDRASLNVAKSIAISNQKDERSDAMKKVLESQSAIQERYDAEYENAKYNLQRQENRSRQRLLEEDKRRLNRKKGLQNEMQVVAAKLSNLMSDEKAESEREYSELQSTKTSKLNDTISQSKRTLNEIQTTKSNISFVQNELNRLEDKSRRNGEVINELEEERGSFRKQLRRTALVALRRIARR